MRHYIIECRVAIHVKDTYVQEFIEFLICNSKNYLVVSTYFTTYNSQNLLALTNLYDSNILILTIPTSVKIKLFHKDKFFPTYKIDLRFTNSSTYNVLF